MKSLIYSAVKKYAQKNPIRLHMPGHKGKGELQNLLDLSFDVTELDAIDNESVRVKAEQECANIYGAKYLRFLTNGATGGIHSALYSVKDLGKKIIISRTSHKSVYNALKICGIEPIILECRESNGIVLPPNAEEIARELKNNTDVIGAFLTYPDYYGNTFDIEKVSAILRKENKLLLIDNAHGGHYNFCENLLCAEKFSDICINSAHKVLPSLNQGAYIICNNDLLVENLTSAVEIFSTTSPSYLILASIEYGIKYISQNKKELNKIYKIAEKVKNQALSEGFNVLLNDDPFKVAIDFGEAGFDSNKISLFLEKENIFAEMDDGRYILFMLSLETTKEDAEKIISAIKKIRKVFKSSDSVFSKNKNIEKNYSVNYLNAINGEYEYVKLEDALGRVSAENVGFFPPCFPILVAGETITKDIIELLSSGTTFGITRGKIKVLRGTKNER